MVEKSKSAEFEEDEINILELKMLKSLKEWTLSHSQRTQKKRIFYFLVMQFQNILTRKRKTSFVSFEIGI
jgi:hypothetical protein